MSASPTLVASKTCDLGDAFLLFSRDCHAPPHSFAIREVCGDANRRNYFQIGISFLDVALYSNVKKCHSPYFLTRHFSLSVFSIVFQFNFAHEMVYSNQAQNWH